MNDQTSFTVSPFDAICKTDEQGKEYWSARELARILTYEDYRNFLKVVVKAKRACEQSAQAISDHFVDFNEMVNIGLKARRKIADIRLSRYACDLILQNSDPEKPIVALGQTYFSVQTRRQEIADRIAALPENQRRLIYRAEMVVDNQRLNETARDAGVISPGDFSTFTDHGYKGLYNGETENMIHARKKLADNEWILDFMGHEELGANIFRATQTEAKLRREQIQGKSAANQTHHQIGQIVRNAIKEAGGTMPEELPTPEKSIQQLQREEQERMTRSKQPSLFSPADGQL